MDHLLHLFILLPLAGFLVSLVLPRGRESLISAVAFGTTGIHLLSALMFVVYWLFNGHPTLNLKDISLYRSTDYEFFLDFCFDKVTVVYLLAGSLLATMVTRYSRYYLHREPGYRRYFNTILFFFTGYNLVVFSGNLETLFIGWEVLGISSFLLIAFYRDRYLPVKNAMKVFSVYRIGDVGLILAMWISHHLFHENITFQRLSNYDQVHHLLTTQSWVGFALSITILIAAAAKSAQLPFTSWLPRAMEGPTPSSAIFYGSLAVHMGVFLLLRTFPFWEHQFSVRILIGVLGAVTSFIASGVARVQSSVKSQIAYASAAQIGLIFIEVAAGLETLALIHFAGNAFLRTYQLLVSPSVVSYLIREQFYNFKPREHTFEDTLPRKIEYTYYMLCLKEWNLDSFLQRIIWEPLRRAGKWMNRISVKNLMLLFIPLYMLGWLLHLADDKLPHYIQHNLPIVLAVVALFMVLKAFAERRNIMLGWILIVMNHCWMALAVSFNEHFSFSHLMLYLSGVGISGLVGYLALRRLSLFEKADLNHFYGHAWEHPKIALVFLMACLGMSGFPITSTFIGEDLLFSHIHTSQVLLAVIASLCFVIDGITLVRYYARIFLGPHVKTYHEVAYKSS
ncbi:MAG: hypothetical protein IM638_08360 [Bacteroidetes bacterium]|nr:hypothetical protein [Bacteroidota bacterium]